MNISLRYSILALLTVSIRNLNKINETDFLSYLGECNWEDVYFETDDNGKISLRNKFLTNAFDKFSPVHVPSRRRKYSPWMTNEMKLLIDKRNNLPRLFKRSKNLSVQINYRKIRNLDQTKIRDERNKYNYQKIVNKSNLENICQLLKKLKLISRKKVSTDLNFSTTDFSNGFSVSTFLSNTSSIVLPDNDTTFDEPKIFFTNISLEILIDVISNIKTSSLDRENDYRGC